ncbi:MAG: hypothetical protein JW867_02495, partial [Candidatus Omnitrophica bacterium]|nr:hypothetical protein [Candidatus Omnitrophota bacterium]
KYEFCLNAILLCGTKKVYPCCRAHTFEKMYNKNYHYYIDTENLYQKLKDLIKETDLCLHCPRMYEDCKEYPAETPRK